MTMWRLSPAASVCFQKLWLYLVSSSLQFHAGKCFWVAICICLNDSYMLLKTCRSAILAVFEFESWKSHLCELSGASWATAEVVAHSCTIICPLCVSTIICPLWSLAVKTYCYILHCLCWTTISLGDPAFKRKRNAWERLPGSMVLGDPFLV